MQNKLIFLTALSGFINLHSAEAATIALFDDRDQFITTTAATTATGPLPDVTGVLYSYQSGSVTFTDVNGYGFWLGGLSNYLPPEWSSLLPGNELAINSVENLNVLFNSPVYSAGFDFIEPTANSSNHPYANNAYYPYADSTFTVTLKNASNFVAQFDFNRPEEIATFVGIWSNQAFDRLEIRETTGGIEDDYFGSFYSGLQPMPVPVPSALWLWLSGMGLLLRTKSKRA